MSSVSFLGMIKKAGALEIGDEMVESLAESGKARAILSASDAGDNSLRRASRYCQYSGAVYLPLPFAKWELGAAVGRGQPGILGISDAGLAAAFAKKLSKEFPGQYDEAADALHQKAERIMSRRKTAGAGKKRRTKK